MEAPAKSAINIATNQAVFWTEMVCIEESNAPSSSTMIASMVPVELWVLPPKLAEVGERMSALRPKALSESMSPLVMMGTLAQSWCHLLLPTGNTRVVVTGV